MVEPVIKAKLQLVTAGEGVGGAEGGVFSESEQRSFRLSQLKSFAALRLLASPIGLTVAGLTAAIIAGIKSLGGAPTPEELFPGLPPAEKAFEDLTDEERKARLEFIQETTEGVDSMGATMTDFETESRSAKEEMIKLQFQESQLTGKTEGLTGKVGELGKEGGVLDWLKDKLSDFGDNLASVFGSEGTGVSIRGGSGPAGIGGRPFIGETPVQGPLMEDGRFFSKQEELVNSGIITNVNRKLIK